MNIHLLTIIIPVYNVENYLDVCIKSIISQTYKSWEVLLIDDGSTDGSSEKCDEWTKKDRRIKVIHTENHGVSHARNVGLDHAHGDYIGFVDADDWIDANMYDAMISKMETTGADACGVGYVREEDGKSSIILRRENEQIFSREEILCQIFSLNIPKILWWELWDKLFKKELITDIRFHDDIASSEDMLFFWQIMKKAKKFAYLPIYSYHYRMRVGSAVHSGITDKSLTRRYALEEIYQDAALTEKMPLKKVMQDFYMTNQISLAKEMLIFSPEKYQEEIKQIQSFVRHNFYSLLKIKNTSLKHKMGLIYLSFPYKLTAFFRSCCDFSAYKEKLKLLLNPLEKLAKNKKVVKIKNMLLAVRQAYRYIDTPNKYCFWGILGISAIGTWCSAYATIPFLQNIGASIAASFVFYLILEFIPALRRAYAAAYQEVIVYRTLQLLLSRLDELFIYPYKLMTGKKDIKGKFKVEDFYKFSTLGECFKNFNYYTANSRVIEMKAALNNHKQQYIPFKAESENLWKKINVCASDIIKIITYKADKEFLQYNLQFLLVESATSVFFRVQKANIGNVKIDYRSSLFENISANEEENKTCKCIINLHNVGYQLYDKLREDPRVSARLFPINFYEQYHQSEE